MSNFVVVIVPADGSETVGAWASASTMMAKFLSSL